MIYIAINRRRQTTIGLSEISDAISSPKAFTAKILQQLVRANLLTSFRGPSGGFILARETPISLKDILKAMGGDQFLSDCFLGLNSCSDINPCPVHNKYKAVREQLSVMVSNAFIQDSSWLDSKYTLT
jgi:Rrf2 family protein